jgi:hypothetical protein
MLLAVVVFREHLGRTGAMPASFIAMAAGVLKVQPGGLSAATSGVVFLPAACLCWAIDNNLTQRPLAPRPHRDAPLAHDHAHVPDAHGILIARAGRSPTAATIAEKVATVRRMLAALTQKVRLRRLVPAVVVAFAALGGLGLRSAYDRLSAGPDCCYPGSPCCHPGAPCCEARKHAAN